MKFTIDIDCTPEEARQFFGMPNVAPIQDKIMQQIQQQLEDNINNMSPEEFMTTWMPATMQGWQDMQKQFFDQMANMGAGSASNSGETNDGQ